MFSPLHTGECWWEPVWADPCFPGSEEWELQSSVLPLCTWSSGAQHFPICSVHMRYGFKTPWGLACIWSLLLAKKPLSPLNSKLYKEPCEAEESRDRSRLSAVPALPLHPPAPRLAATLGDLAKPFAAWDRTGILLVLCDHVRLLPHVGTLAGPCAPQARQLCPGSVVLLSRSG